MIRWSEMAWTCSSKAVDQYNQGGRWRALGGMLWQQRNKYFDKVSVLEISKGRPEGEGTWLLLLEKCKIGPVYSKIN